MVGSEEFATRASMTPTALDYLADHPDGVHQMEFQVDTNAGRQPCAYALGATFAAPTDGMIKIARPLSYPSHPNDVLIWDINLPDGTAYYHKPPVALGN